MGTIKEGINGPFRGKAGSVIGSRWRKINYIKGLPRKKERRKPSQPQAEARTKFALLNRFLDPLSQLLEASFGSFTSRATGRNAAFSYNYDHAFTTVDGDVQLNYPELRFSHGSLVTAGDERAWVADGMLHVSWDPNTYGMGGEQDDKACVFVYNVGYQRFLPITEATRQDGAARTVTSKPNIDQTELHVWLLFMDKLKKRASKTVYIPITEAPAE